ncbi:hypothetical protein VWZ37_22970, partial [Xanthomonas citri pv. citri]
MVFSKFFQRQLIYFLYYLKIYELDTGTNGLLNRQLLNAHTTGLKRFAHPCNACKSTIGLFMKITFIKMIVLGVLVGSSAGAGAAPPSSDGELLKSSSILQEEVDLATARIRSSKQFEAYLAATPSSVAFKLPPSVLSKFRRSMVFTERGLASEVSPHFFLRDQALGGPGGGRRCAHGARFKVIKPEKSADHAR